ncbi:MAG: CTP synthase [Candidatus Nomurabacteria bacterium]|jgi:CTP synthase|nr:CTP synthase [Candidatus Nomurabacteria bacterium]
MINGLTKKTHAVNSASAAKYIFVVGGVLSGVGKGITAASIGAILQAKGLKVSIQKCDPYLNVDAGMLNPIEHGECFVTHDGRETDLDLGHYERFLDIETNRFSTTLSGDLFSQLIASERAGKFGGRTVQLVPHFTNLIQDTIEKSQQSQGSDVHIVEIGGTVGDIESQSFIEAIREFRRRVGIENCLYVSVVWVPWINTSKELKTKPAQNALRDLRGFGIIADLVCARTERPAPREICAKIANFASLPEDAVVNLPDVSSVYDVPLNLVQSGVLDILDKFAGGKKADMAKWHKISAARTKKYPRTVRVGLVAKYVGNEDAYICVAESLKAAAAANKTNLEIVWINAEKAGSDHDFALREFGDVDGLLVPGGFGTRGVDGKIAAATYALQNDKPYLGICLGLQVAAIAAARLGGVEGASSEEFGADSKNNIIYIMNDQKGLELTGGTMRLGDYPAKIVPKTKTATIYSKSNLVERHRHRYEVNQKFLPQIKKGGLVVSGTSPDGKLVEFMESPSMKFMVATQAHPEFRSRPDRPHPLFDAFIRSLL